MTQEALNELLKRGEVGRVQNPESENQPIQDVDEMAKYVVLMEVLRKLKYPVSTIPTAVPKTFLDQIVFYENGTTRRLYIYLNQTWRHTTLT